MTPEEFHLQFRELSTTSYLYKVASKFGAGAETKDIVQDVLELISQKRPEDYAHVRDLKVYVAQAVHRAAMAWVMKKRRAPAVEPLDEATHEQVFEAFQALPKDPYEIYELEQYRRILHRAVELLEPLDRAIATETHEEGASIRDTAERLGIGPDHVRGGIRRLWRTITELLAKAGKKGDGKHGT